MRNVRLAISGAALTVALLLNPMVACNRLEARHASGPTADQMAAQVVGTWDLRVEGAAVRTVVISPARAAPPPPPTERASWIAPAAACSNHTVIASAAACRSSWTMPLLVEVTAGAAVVTGVGSLTTLGGVVGTLTLEFGRETLSGEIADGRATLFDPAARQGATLVRRTP